MIILNVIYLNYDILIKILKIKNFKNFMKKINIVINDINR